MIKNFFFSFDCERPKERGTEKKGKTREYYKTDCNKIEDPILVLVNFVKNGVAGVKFDLSQSRGNRSGRSGGGIRDSSGGGS